MTSKKEIKFKTDGYDITIRAFREEPDPDNEGKMIQVLRPPDEIYEEIKAECPDNLIIYIDELLSKNPNQYFTKEQLAYILWGGQSLGLKTTRTNRVIYKTPTWLNSTRERNIRDSIAELVTYLSRPIIASSHEYGYVYATDPSILETGLKDLRKRYNTLGLRLLGLEKAEVKLKAEIELDAISDFRLLRQKSLEL